MIDRGEKIVNLAREMLQSDFSIESPPASGAPPSLASQVKAVCFAALLAAFGSQFVTHAIDQARRPLNRYEKVELEALIFYANETKGVDQDALRRELFSKLSRQGFDDLTRADFDSARGFLQDRLR